jgi:hypothetical protein
MEPSIILQPGPACLTDGFDALEKIIGKYEWLKRSGNRRYYFRYLFFS